MQVTEAVLEEDSGGLNTGKLHFFKMSNLQNKNRCVVCNSECAKRGGMWTS